jgi:hypothetical protein
MKRGDLTAPAWKDKQNVTILTNMHHPPAEGNFCDEHGNTATSLNARLCQMYGYVDKTESMTNIYSISRQMWKWTKKLLFPLLELSILNSFIFLTPCDSKLS